MKKCNVKCNILVILIAGCLLTAKAGSSPADYQPGNTISVSADDTFQDIISKAAHVVPSARQLAWQKLEFQAFIHFGMNTFTDQEWGSGKEDPKLFNPVEFNADQWVSAFKAASMKGVILTAKHHDGFCLWPSKYTEHSVKNSPWKNGRGDVMRELSEACRRGGLSFGVYLSPWDRHEPIYGDSPRYNEYFRNQLTELLTNYGEISEVWFDGACGEGPNGKRQIYDWGSYYKLIRHLQPGAVISIVGPDVRWCGNEAGNTRKSEWSVLPARKIPENFKGDPAFGRLLVDGHKKDLGSREKLRNAQELIWFPAQVNTSIRPGWFYHANQDNQVKSLKHLLDIYYTSLGGNGQFLLNIPPDARGLIHENDVARLKELGDILRETFRRNLVKDARVTASQVRGNDPQYAPQNIVDGKTDTYWLAEVATEAATIEFDLPSAKTFNRAMLMENIKVGQRVEQFTLEIWNGQQWQEIAQSTVIGYKRLLRFSEVTTQKVRIRILQSRLCPTLSEFGLYLEPQIPITIRDIGAIRNK